MQQHENERQIEEANEIPTPSNSSSSQSFLDNEADTQLTQLVFTWLSQPTYREERRFLEAHPELLSSASNHIFTSLLERAAQQKKEVAEELLDHVALLTEIRTKGGSVEVIREAYIDRYGGFVLDAPPWLEAIEGQLAVLADGDQSEQTVFKRVRLLQAAIVQAQNDPLVAQEMLADLHLEVGNIVKEVLSIDQLQVYNTLVTAYQIALQAYPFARYRCRHAWIQYNLGNTYWEHLAINRTLNTEEAIACYEAALQFYTHDAFPVEWAAIQHNLGNMYRERIIGTRRTNVEQAITFYQAALQVYTFDTYPFEWAMIHNNLGMAYRVRLEGERPANLEQAIACHEAALHIYTRQAFPAQWAMSQLNLGDIYYKRVVGENRTNLEAAIAHYEAASQILTIDTYPLDWAAVQGNLGTVYIERIEGDRRANIEQAIAYYEATLPIYTRENFPAQWATSQHNLGMAYSRRIAGERRDNLERAMTHYNNALQVRDSKRTPVDWADTQHNLGVVYSVRIEGNHAANLERAIACYRAVLEVRTEEAFPYAWATTLHAIGNIYRERIIGDRRANLEQAIAYYQAALRNFTRHDFAVEWAHVQHSMGMTYHERIEGDRRTNLEQAIACYEAALQVRTERAFPREWAMTQHNLGTTYSERIAGERRTNLERAIAYYEATLQVYTREAFPLDWATTQLNLGAVYSERIAGEPLTNVEQAIACYEAALQVRTREAFPVDWAILQHNLGSAYTQRGAGERSTNLEQAITCFQVCLQVRTREQFPFDWAATQHNLGIVYTHRLTGEQQNNREEAIACFQAALQVYTPENFPLDWAMTQNNLGNVYSQHFASERQANLEQAIVCYHAALQVYTLDAFPADYRSTQLNCAFAEAERQNWSAAHAAYQEAHTAEELLLRLGAGAVGYDTILKGGHNAATRDGFVLARLGQLAASAVVIERGRVRGLAEAFAVDAADPAYIQDLERRKHYRHAREAFITAQTAINAPLARDLSERERRQMILGYTEMYFKAKDALDAIIKEIRMAQDPPDFLEDTLDASTILQTAQHRGVGHALVYLAATPWGGTTIIAVNTHTHQESASFSMLDLPTLTDSFLNDLLHTKLDVQSGQLLGGYGYAQEGSGFALLSQQWPGKTFHESATALHLACTTTGQASTLDKAAQKVLGALADVVNQPFTQLEREAIARLSNTFGHFFLHLELERCLEALAEVAIRPLVTWLLAQGVSSLTLIPCGVLAAFPLAAVALSDERTVGETLRTNIALSVRSLVQEDATSSKRIGIYTLGDPRPTHQELRWSEAEAHTLATLARTRGLPGEARVHEKAVRSWLVKALQTGQVVDISCHGQFDASDFLQSSLQLARGQRLTLAEALNRTVDLRGLRLLILSACQTAILDLRGAVNEVRSLAAGMIQAGAKAVLAALWSVDDKATYLLMVRFLQEWLPDMEQESPAVALTRAQQWLRTVTYRELQQWRMISLPHLTHREQQKAGAVAPEYDPWAEEEHLIAGAAKLATVRGRGNRYDIGEAGLLLRTEAAQHHDPDSCPYASPIYWAGFQITGW